MTVKLAVAGAFHTEFMQPAVEQLRGALAATNIVTPRIPVISNVDAHPHSDPDTIKDVLARQVCTGNELATSFHKLLIRHLQCRCAAALGPRHH